GTVPAGVAAPPASPPPAPPTPAAGSPAERASQRVAEPEAPVSSPKSAEAPDPATGKDTAAAAPAPAPRRQDPPPVRATAPASKSARAERTAPPRTARTAPVTTARTGAPSAPVEPPPATVAAAVPPPAPELPKPVEPAPAPPHVPQFEHLVLPAASVIGLQMESSLSSERSRVEDRVDARVTRDVMSGGRVAIPAGARVIGSVTLVDRGGKLKTPARLGIRFHTLILSDGSEGALNTEPFYREGESPPGSGTEKIGGPAVGGASLRESLGRGKGAA